MSEAARTHLDSLVQDSQVPGIQYAVVTVEGVIFEYHGGYADLASLSPMKAGTTMMAYSMSKTITAAAVLHLVETHNLDLDQPVNQFLDVCPYGPGVTIRRLLSHTAGVPNPIPLRWVHAPASHQHFNEHMALTTVLQKHQHLSFSPGSKYGYSNIGYWLLGEFIESVSKEPFTSYISKHLLQTLGMTGQDLGYTICTVPEHAHGYLEKYSLLNVFKHLLIGKEYIGAYHDRWLEIRPHYVNGAAFGGLVGTAAGFARFLQDQLQPHSAILSDASRSQFYTPQKTNRGSLASTSPGWHISPQKTNAHFYKEGAGGGFHSMMRLYPDHGIASVVMTNTSAFNVRRLMDKLDPYFINVADKQ
ncbi:serine hydrolase domain-containing protein [Undibacterium sp. TS12]|uniref:serine hydrolase domain-containing protein n=1 Tax=Undibacterium sp. TS12 TaxID=2908202 RepID=UPI001F4C9B02|nr:serine hydrolase domain-containing protein [Undibacterium sp. TS12]MCH8622547.1 beta-lactamase family protein [Undibacterium sp. TS12]